MTNNVEKKTNNIWLFLSLAVFIGLLLLGYKYKNTSKQADDIVINVDKSCDLHQGACVSSLPNGGQVSFSLEPKDIPTLKPLDISVKTTNVDASKVEVDIIGINMDMGYNRPSLEKVNDTNFKGKVIIPACFHPRMDWEAKVLLTTKDGARLVVPFHFYTLNNKATQPK